MDIRQMADVAQRFESTGFLWVVPTPEAGLVGRKSW
jgi:hypothetical protein